MSPFLSFKLFVTKSSCSPTVPQTVKVTVLSLLPNIYQVPQRREGALLLVPSQELDNELRVVLGGQEASRTSAFYYRRCT